MFKSTNAKWAAKLLKSRNFVVMTDTESALMFKGVDPSSFDDFLSLTAQIAELDKFIAALLRLKKEHNKAYVKLLGVKQVTKRVNKTKTSSTKSTKKVTKIQVN